MDSPVSERVGRLQAEVRAAWEADQYAVPYVRVAPDIYAEFAAPFPKRFAGVGLRVEGADVVLDAGLAPGTWEIES